MEPTLLQSAKEPFKRNTFAFCLSPHTLYPYISEFCISLNVFFLLFLFLFCFVCSAFFFYYEFWIFVCLFAFYICVAFISIIFAIIFCHHTGNSCTKTRAQLLQYDERCWLLHPPTRQYHTGIGSSCFVSLPSFTFSLVSSSSCESDHYSAACAITCFQRIFF